MHLSIVSTESVTSWPTRDMHLEEFLSIWSTHRVFSPFISVNAYV